MPRGGIPLSGQGINLMTDEKCAGLTVDEDVAISVLREVGRLAHLADCALAACLPDPMTVAQYAVLDTLFANDGLSITQLAELHTVSQPTMSSTIAKLRDHGLIETNSKPGDRRSRFVTLTQEGADMRVRCETAAGPMRHDTAAIISREDWMSLQATVNGLSKHFIEVLNRPAS